MALGCCDCGTFTIVLAVGLLWNNKTKTSETAAQGEQEHAHQENEKDEPKQYEKDEKHETEESLSLTAEQMQQHSVKLAQVALGEVNQIQLSLKTGGEYRSSSACFTKFCWSC